MTVGIQIFNDAGTILIDENYSNLALSQRGYVTLPSYGETSFTIPNCRYPLLGFKASGLLRTWYWFNSDGTTITVSIKGNGGARVDWYLFDTIVSAANYGLVIYRDDGSVAFDGSKSYARVVDIWSGTDFPSSPVSKTYASGRSYAQVILKSGYWRFVHSSPDPDAPENGNTIGWLEVTEQKYSTFTWSGTKLTVSSQYTMDSVPAPKGIYNPQNNSPSWAVAILDVTGY